jgi:hypothetical protein
MRAASLRRSQRRQPNLRRTVEQGLFEPNDDLPVVSLGDAVHRKGRSGHVSDETFEAVAIVFVDMSAGLERVALPVRDELCGTLGLFDGRASWHLGRGGLQLRQAVVGLIRHLVTVEPSLHPPKNPYRDGDEVVHGRPCHCRYGPHARHRAQPLHLLVLLSQPLQHPVEEFDLLVDVQQDHQERRHFRELLAGQPNLLYPLAETFSATAGNS